MGENEEHEFRRLYVCEWPALKCVSNLPITDRPYVMQAKRIAKVYVEWDDKPDSRMGPEFGDTPAEMAKYGSVWSNGDDLSDFWDAFYRVKGNALARQSRREHPYY